MASHGEPVRIRLQVSGAAVPFFPILRRDGPIVLHDVHHMLTGYGFNWRGELEVAAWASHPMWDFCAGHAARILRATSRYSNPPSGAGRARWLKRVLTSCSISSFDSLE